LQDARGRFDPQDHRMSTGLLALLDDVAGIAKVAAASVDDVAAKAAKAGAKAAGVVIDDAAVTPRYVTGFRAERELPIVRRIALGSLRNKLLILLPGALALSAFAPWAITPLLVLGGAFLCYEGAEKVWEAIAPHAAHAHEEKVTAATDPQSLEDAKVAGAIRTDLILSAEIMAITLAALPADTIWTQAVILAVVGIAITIAVYGAVALIVKADDAGLALAARGGPPGTLGRALVRGMPPFLKALGVVGTAAMLWVGGGIILHGVEEYGPDGLAHLIHDVIARPGLLGWLVGAVASGVFGLAMGAAPIPLVGQVLVPAARGLRHAMRR
jgi:predicted DNA repair protein MutK